MYPQLARERPQSPSLPLRLETLSSMRRVPVSGRCRLLRSVLKLLWLRETREARVYETSKIHRVPPHCRRKLLLAIAPDFIGCRSRNGTCQSTTRSRRRVARRCRRSCGFRSNCSGASPPSLHELPLQWRLSSPGGRQPSPHDADSSWRRTRNECRQMQHLSSRPQSRRLAHAPGSARLASAVSRDADDLGGIVGPSTL